MFSNRIAGRRGLDGLYAHGTAGEFHALGEDEYDRVNALLAERCEPHRLPFQIGAGHMSAQTCLARVGRARALRPGAIQVTLPDWLPLSRGEVVRFLARVAAAADPVPLVRHAAGLAVFVPGHDLATGRRHGAAGSYSNIAARAQLPWR
ncbi:hypothetical protein [Nonomuraea sp. B19D2]|uniref:hypothetical protein n=1 Tax=Nonomuraea sp. B19D2 TaxID=3159561 RepID=UPI0032DA3D68